MLAFEIYNPYLRSFISAACVLLIVCQALHVFFIRFLFQREAASSRVRFSALIAYELSLLLYLILAFFALRSIDVSDFYLFRWSIPVPVAFGGAVIPLTCGVVNLFANGMKRELAVELLLFACLLWGLLAGYERMFFATFVVVMAFLVFRTVRCIVENERLRRSSLTRFSMVDAVNKLPVAVICLGPSGNMLIMNQAMRSCFIKLDLSNDFDDLDDVWKQLENGALSEPAFDLVDTVQKLELASQDKPLVLTAHGRYRVFEKIDIEWDKCRVPAIIATDITEEVRLNQAIEESNFAIAAAGDEIKKSLEGVQQVAREEAMLIMRAKVHDIIGQRLSILHRMLEDNRLDDESIAQVKPLLSGLLADLRVCDFDAQSELEAIASAFALICVDLQIVGSLPEDERVARVFVDVIREASTNAVRHAQARCVEITMARDGEDDLLTVKNEVPLGAVEMRVGTGIPGMRKVLERLDGTLEIATDSEFCVCARVPHREHEESEGR